MYLFSEHKYIRHLIDELWPLEQLWLKQPISAPGHHPFTLVGKMSRFHTFSWMFYFKILKTNHATPAKQFVASIYIYMCILKMQYGIFYFEKIVDLLQLREMWRLPF